MKRTFQPSNKVRKNRRGFRSRMSTNGGKKVLSNRRQKGRKTLCLNSFKIKKKKGIYITKKWSL